LSGLFDEVGLEVFGIPSSRKIAELNGTKAPLSSPVPTSNGKMAIVFLALYASASSISSRKLSGGLFGFNVFI
jgi:hypothetical protein